ncbi:MAG TPA: nitroreductase family deazaflavin-dependent oxidoreductase [Ilumatobacteraceae bacterium]|nr:nitroreductase family deazaflavin-dependent oxidoreductase [Ilumatobacteraceae bacterium]
MGVLDELDYVLKPANAAQRVTQRIAASGPGAWVFQRTLYPLDKVLYKRTGGRRTLASLMAGLPVIMLTTTGAKSGDPRSMPLVGIPIDGDVAIIGSNYGQRRTPGWVYNLGADPTATVSYGDRSVDVTARAASDDEADQAFEVAAMFYPGYGKYRARASHRPISVFVLEQPQ